MKKTKKAIAGHRNLIGKPGPFAQGAKPSTADSITKKRKDGVNMLLSGMAVLMLENIEKHSSPQMRTAIKKQVQGVVQQWGSDLPQLVACKNVVEKLVHKLIACEDLSQVALALNAVEAINTKSMLLLADDQEIIMADKKEESTSNSK